MSAALGASCRLATATASSRTPRITAVKSVVTNAPAPPVMSLSGPTRASRTPGAPSRRIAWLCVAAIPTPSHSASNVIPAVPSHGRPRTSSANIAGSSSPSGIAVVTIRSAMPEPLPKCLSPETAYGRPSMKPVSPVGLAVAFVRPMSPPLPGSEVIVPHWSPASAVSKTARRWASQSGCDGSGLSNQ